MAKPRKILIVDDDEDQTAYLRHFIGLWGYETHVAADGPEALEAVKSFQPDMILLDLYLPTIPGLEVLKRIREDRGQEDIPVFIISSEESDEVRIVCMSSGATEYIIKPIQPFDLSMKIQNTLEMLDYRRQIVTLNNRLNREKGILLRYFSRDLVEKILNDEISPELGGALVNAAVFFFDLRGSTGIAEAVGPKEYAVFVSNLFGELMDIVFENNGSINEIMGDGILASFGCPVETGDNSYHAVQAALSIREHLRKYNEERLPDYLTQPVRFGIGIASGRIFAGNIGSESRMKYALMGDPVNKASRIQDLTRDQGCDILVDEATVQGLSERVSVESRGAFQLRGKKEESELFCVL